MSCSSDDLQDTPAIVIDNGSHSIKAGFAGDEAPCAVLPSVVDGSQPIEKGIVTNWDAMEKLWCHTYSQLKVSPSDQPVLLSESPDNPKANREKMLEVMFEALNVPALYINMQQVLTLYAYGRCSGFVLDSGYEVSHAVPIYEVPRWIQSIELGGRDVTKYLQQLLAEAGQVETTDVELYRKMKEELCYVSNSELNTDNKQYNLPDGQTITVTNEALTCSELLFTPPLINKDCSGIHTMCYHSILNSEKEDAHIFKELRNGIVLSGGNSMLPGFTERMQTEVTNISGFDDIKVVAFPDRDHAAWVGGSCKASLSTFQGMWVTRGDYEEKGVSVVHTHSVF